MGLIEFTVFVMSSIMAKSIVLAVELKPGQVVDSIATHVIDLNLTRLRAEDPVAADLVKLVIVAQGVRRRRLTGRLRPPERLLGVEARVREPSLEGLLQLAVEVALKRVGRG